MLLQDGWTALHQAASRGHEDVIRLLLDQDPNVITKTSNVSKQLHHMGYMYVPLIIRSLMQNVSSIFYPYMF